MLHFYNRAGFARALTLDLDSQLKQLLTKRITALAEDLIDYTEYLIVQAGDTEEDIVRHIGLSPLIDAVDGIRYGEPGFNPSWDIALDHGGWLELVFTFGSAFAYVVFISDHVCSDAFLRKMCREFAS